MSLYETIGRTVEACGISSLVPSKAEEMGVYTLSIVARPGDHICVRGATHPLWHHGIRGDHDTVYEMSGDSKETAKIRRCSMDSFVSTALAAAIIRYDYDSDNWKQASLRVAEEFCSRDDLHPAAYNILYSNCECFATWCRILRCDGTHVKLFSELNRLLGNTDPFCHVDGDFKRAHLLQQRTPNHSFAKVGLPMPQVGIRAG